MDYVFRDKPFARVYLNVVVKFSNTDEEHIQNLRIFFQSIGIAGINLKTTKCAFLDSSGKLLGHFVDKHVVSVYKEKTSAIKQASLPKNTTDLRSFLGLAGSNCRFIKNFSGLSAAADIVAATFRNQKLYCTEETKKAFKTLNIKRETKLTARAGLSQIRNAIHLGDGGAECLFRSGTRTEVRTTEGSPHAICMSHHELLERNYSKCESKALTILFTIRKLPGYLLTAEPFALGTDHHTLQSAFKKERLLRKNGMAAVLSRRLPV